MSANRPRVSGGGQVALGRWREQPNSLAIRQVWIASIGLPPWQRTRSANTVQLWGTVVIGFGDGPPGQQPLERQRCDDAERASSGQHAGERKVRRFEQFPVLVNRALACSSVSVLQPAVAVTKHEPHLR